VVDGGRDKDWDNGGSHYIESQFNTEKAGPWPGGFVDFRVEKRYGSFANDEAGTLPAVNMVGLSPEPEEDSPFISELMATKFVAPWLGFFFGRFDTPRACNPMVGGVGQVASAFAVTLATQRCA
jgi:hypothetical protein